MARFSVQIPSLIGGVSQQSPNLRLVSQCEAQTNAYPSLVDGLMRRHPIDHGVALDNLDGQSFPPRDDHVHIINRDPGEQYMVVLSDGYLRVKELATGNTVPVFNADGGSADLDYLELGSEPANVNIKCVTIADYTLVLNRLMRVALSDDLTPTDPSDNEGFLFVRVGNYSTTYRAFLQQLDTEYEVAVSTWDGQAPAVGVAERWELTINSVGTVGQVWSVTIFGQTATYTVVALDTPTDVANGLQPGINAITGVSASDSGAVVTIIADTVGVHFLPSVTPPTGGSYGLVNTVTAAETAELTSIDTGDIAQALMDAILALPGSPFTAERLGPVVHVMSTDPISTIRVEDGHDGTDFLKVHRSVPAIDSLPLVGVDGFTIKVDGGTAGSADDYYATFELDSAATAEEWELTITAAGDVGKTWTVTILGNAATYTVQTGDTPNDVAAGLGTAIAALSDVGASVTNNVITITADDPGPHITPHVQKATNGQYTLERTTDSVGTFGAGKWVEGRGFDLPVGLDPETMPWQLIRRQDDAAGSITTIPFAKYFEWSPTAWVERAVGDAESAPDPSIAGSMLSDMFFFRDRLGFTSGQNVIMSEVGRFFNLYRTTVLSLPDGDPIDITVPSQSVVRIHKAVPLRRRLVLFADDTQFVLDGDPILTPGTVQVAASSQYRSNSDADPVTDADGAYFASSRADFSGVRRLYPQDQIDGQFLSEDTTVAVPQYIPGPVLQMAIIESEGLLVCLSDDDRRALYLYKTYRVGDQRLQSAWFRYDLGENAIVQGFGVIGNTLHLLVHRTIGAYLESSVIQSDLVDDGADYLTHLDRRVTASGGVYSGITGRTTWTVPYAYDNDEDYFAVVKSTTGVDGGDVYPLTADSSTNLVTVFSAQGDHSAETLWIGQGFETRYEFSKLYLKSDAAAGGQALRTGGRLQALHGSLVFERTASLRVDVTPRLRPTRSASAPFSGLSINEALLGALSLPASEFRFPVYSSDARVEVVADGPLPMALQAAQFEVEFAPRMGTYRGS